MVGLSIWTCSIRKWQLFWNLSQLWRHNDIITWTKYHFYTCVVIVIINQVLINLETWNLVYLCNLIPSFNPRQIMFKKVCLWRHYNVIMVKNRCFWPKYPNFKAVPPLNLSIPTNKNYIFGMPTWWAIHPVNFVALWRV